MFSKITNLNFQRILLTLAYAGVSLIVWKHFGDTVREPKWALLQACALILMIQQLPQMISIFRRVPIQLWLFLIFLSVQGFYFLQSRFYWQSLANILALFFLGQLFLQTQNQKDKNWHLYLLAIAIVPNLLLGALQILRIDPIFNLSDDRFLGLPTGFLGQHTFFGLLMCLVGLVLLTKNQNILCLICVLFSFATTSIFSMLSLATGFLGWLIWRKKYKTAAGFFLFGVFSAVIAFQSGLLFFSDNGRFLIWRMIVDAVIERPWLGYGFTSFGQEFYLHHQGVSGDPWLQAHNEFLELLFDAGIVGFLIGLVVAILPFFKFKNWWRQEDKLPYFLVYIALLTNSLGNFPFHLAPFALYGITAYFALWNADRPLLDH